MANWEGYRAIKAEAERVGWPKHYRTDLTKHDRLRMSRQDAPEAFVWVLRECGTMLNELGNGNELPWLLATRAIHGPMPNYAGRAARWYIYEDGELERVTPDEAVERFIESIKDQPVYKRRRDGTHVRIGTLRSVDPRVRTAYGDKTSLTIKPSRESGATIYFLRDNIRIGELESAS